MAKKKMSEEEKKSWESLYMYVKSLLGYDENQALSSTMVLRLKGLLTGKFIENKHIDNMANYSYDVILNTFKYCRQDIDRALQTNNFKDEQHRFNYILKIVEKNINDVYLRMKNAKKAEEKAEKTDMSYAVGYKNTFKKKEYKVNDRFKELW